MTRELRPIRHDELEAYYDQINLVFNGSHAPPEVVTNAGPHVELDRTLAWFEDGSIVSSAGVHSFRMAVPGGALLPTAGLTRVTVLPTHRRQGLLTGMMREHLDDAQRRGEPLAALYASEAPIYGRFGYGVGTHHASISLPHGAPFREPLDIRGRVRLLSRPEALRLAPGIAERVAPQQPGMVLREPGFWELRVEERMSFGQRPPSELSWAACGDRGYAAYRIRTSWSATGPQHEVVLMDLFAADPETYRVLWRYVLDIDLATSVEARDRPRSEPLEHLLADSRAVKSSVHDGLWIRLVDVAAALAGRRYGVEGRLALEVSDAFCDWNQGGWTLEGGPDGATCLPGGDADLALSAADLSTVYLGDSSFHDLVWAGRALERRPGAAKLADSMFASPVVPWCPFHF